MVQWGMDCVLLEGKSRVLPGCATGAKLNQRPGHCAGIAEAQTCAASCCFCCVGENMFGHAGILASAALTIPLGSWACGGLFKLCLET